MVKVEVYETANKGIHDPQRTVRKKAQRLLTEEVDQSAPKHVAVLASNGNRHFGHRFVLQSVKGDVGRAVTKKLVDEGNSIVGEATDGLKDQVSD